MVSRGSELVTVHLGALVPLFFLPGMGIGMRILKRKGLTKRQLNQLDNYWWASVDQTLRIVRDQGISPEGFETRTALCQMVEEFADAIGWLRELSREGRHANYN